MVGTAKPSTPTPEASVSERERIARIVDPGAWALADKERTEYPADPHWRIYETPELQGSLAKADAILSRPEPSEAVVEAVEGGDAVNYITPEENRALVAFQKRVHADWVQDYAEVGIELRNDPRPAPAWFYRSYEIQGIRYPNMHVAKTDLNMTTAEIRRRCSSKARIWSDWQVA